MNKTLKIVFLIIVISVGVYLFTTDKVFAQSAGDAIGDAIGDASGGAADFGSPLATLISEESGFVFQAWKVTRSVINILLIIALMAISFSNITRISIDTYTIKKALPNLIIGIILANASLYIVRFMSDITTVVTYFFVNQTKSTDFADFLGDAVQLIGVNSIKTTLLVTGFLAPLLVFLFALVTIVGLLWLAFLLYFRLVSIYLLTILSPLAFVSYGIPGFDKYFKQWWQQFTKWLFIVPAMAGVFWLMLVIGNAGGNNQSVARLLIMYVLFFTALTLPSKMGGAVVDKASKAFMKYTGANAALNASKEYASLKGQQIGYRLPGVAKYQAWRDLQKENAMKDIDQLKKRGRNKILAGKTGQNLEKLKLLDKEISMTEESILAQKEVEAGNLKGGFRVKHNASISERLIIAEYKKKLEEEKKNANDAQEKLEFLSRSVPKDKNDNDDTSHPDYAKNKATVDLLKNVFKETINQEVASKEVGRAEGMQKGNIATGFLQPLQAAANYSQLRAELESIDKNDPRHAGVMKAMGSIKESFEKLKMREGNEEFKNFKDIDDFMLAYDPSDEDKKDEDKMKIISKYKKDFGSQINIWQGRQRQTAKMFNEGVVSQIETDVKEQTVTQLERELKNYLEKDLNLKGSTEQESAERRQQFMRGDTAALSAGGLSDKDIRSGRVIMEKYKQLMRSTNDIRNKDALNSFIKNHNEVLEGTEFEFNQELIENAGSTEIKDRRDAAGYIAQASGIISGQPHYANQKGNPNAPKPYEKPVKKQPGTNNPGQDKPNFNQDDIDYATDNLGGGYGTPPNPNPTQPPQPNASNPGDSEDEEPEEEIL